MDELAPASPQKDEEAQKQITIGLLEKHKIPYKDWGQGKAKTLEHLNKEINDGETILREEDGKLYRELFVTAATIRYRENGKTYQLVEEKQVFTDGRTRERKLANSLSEKIKPDEDPDTAIIRGIEEELGIQGHLNAVPRENNQSVEESPSFPGLLTRYNVNVYDVDISSDQYNPDGFQEEQTDKTTYFVWKEVD